MEWKLFDGPVAPFTDSEFYKDREAAHHLEQYGHSERLQMAAEFVRQAYDTFDVSKRDPHVVDLGCGDGGMLSLLRDMGIPSYGYDMQPSNIDYARDVRGVDAFFVDFSTEPEIEADIVILTEVLEHVTDPHGIVRNLETQFLVASSPFHETGDAHYEFHVWAWDDEGYDAMLIEAGYEIIRHEHAWLNQVVLAKKVS